MTDVTLRNAQTAAMASMLSSLTYNNPTGLADGDLLLLGVVWDDSVNTLTTPSGYTRICQQQLSTLASPSRTFAVYQKTASGEPSSVTLNWGGSTNAACAVLGYYNVNATTPVEVKNPDDAANATDSIITGVTARSVTTSTARDMLLMFGVDNTGGNTITWTVPSSPGTFTKQADIQPPGKAMQLAVFDFLWTSSGATGTVSATASAAHRNAFFLLAIAPLAATSGIVFRKTLSSLGTRAGSRQVHGN